MVVCPVRVSHAVISGFWLGFGVAARGVYLLVPAAVPVWTWPMVWVIASIAATRSVWRARVLRRCLPVGVVAPFGHRAIVTAAGTAARQWPSCLLLCGPVMMAMVGAHHLPIMLGGSAAVWWEQRHPRSWRDPVPVAILAATAILVIGIQLFDADSI